MATGIQKVVVTGACGQIGTELVPALRERYGVENVLSTDVIEPQNPIISSCGHFEVLDVTKKDSTKSIIKSFGADAVFHLAAILSAKGEKNPALCWDVNMNGTINILDIGVELKLSRVIVPSSIAVFGPDTPRENTPNDTILRPTTIYGVTKVAAERLGDYYVKRFGLDVRGLRYPGIISSEALPGGGTTDYAVEIFYKAIEEKRYKCFLEERTRLPMMYMPDCIAATLDLAEADFSRLVHHCDFNVAAMSFTAGELAASIKKHIPEFEISYEPDYRQAIADSWPASIDDSAAREEWNWKPDWNLDSMTRDMLQKLSDRHKAGKLYG